jgi:dTDP-4-amino-4,6-dideoxy-D-galactose acyltransferase
MMLHSWQTLAFLERIFPLSYSREIPPHPESLRVRRLSWDSDFFQAEMYRLDYLPEGTDAGTLLQHLPAPASNGTMIFAEVPTQATEAIRTLCLAGFSMVETRLTYFHTLQHLPEISRPARRALSSDAEFLRRAASGARNPFDRYHTDPFFTEHQASRYLETYIENCLNGFAEIVLVPDLPKPPASFAALSRAEVPGMRPGEKLYRIPLTACLEENRGWHYHLCLAALHQAAENQAIALVMTTQAANSAVVHNCEKLGFRLGSAFHIFSKTIS